MFIVLNEWLVPFAQQTFQTLAQSSEKGFKIVWTHSPQLCAHVLLTLVLISSRLNSCGTACTSYRRQERRAITLTSITNRNGWVANGHTFHIFHILLATQTFSFSTKMYLQLHYEHVTCLVVLAVKVLILPRQSSCFQHHRDWATPWPPRDQCPCRCLAWH